MEGTFCCGIPAHSRYPFRGEGGDSGGAEKNTRKKGNTPAPRCLTMAGNTGQQSPHPTPNPGTPEGAASSRRWCPSARDSSSGSTNCPHQARGWRSHMLDRTSHSVVFLTQLHSQLLMPYTYSSITVAVTTAVYCISRTLVGECRCIWTTHIDP